MRLKTALCDLEISFENEAIKRISFVPETEVLNEKTSRTSDWIPKLTSELIAYLEGKITCFSSFPFSLTRYSEFQISVWKAISTISYGEVLSYGELADQIKRPKSARAVGRACGGNPFPLLIPCHRVVARQGALGGFSGGIDIKKKLLKLEGVLL